MGRLTRLDIAKGALSSKTCIINPFFRDRRWCSVGGVRYPVPTPPQKKLELDVRDRSGAHMSFLLDPQSGRRERGLCMSYTSIIQLPLLLLLPSNRVIHLANHSPRWNILPPGLRVALPVELPSFVP